MPQKAERYLLKVTAGPSYDAASHQVVNVNTPAPVRISSTHMTTDLNVRIQSYRGKC